MRATFHRFGLFGMLFLLLFLVFPGASAAVVKGAVYNLYLDQLNKAIVTIDSTPEQTMVSKDGGYSFLVPKGRYHLEALYEEGDLIYKADENLVITADGEYVVDLILVPSINDVIDVVNETKNEFGAFEADSSPIGLVITLVIILFFLMYIILTKAHFIEEEEVHNPGDGNNNGNAAVLVDQPVSLPEGEDVTDKLLSYIKESGGRVTQKDLRKKFQLSEAKVSLLVADLESKQLIKKIKRGRGNIIVLP